MYPQSVARSIPSPLRDKVALTILHIDALDRKIDDRRILLLYEVVFREPAEMQNDERWKLRRLVPSDQACRFLECDTVVFGKHLRDGHLRNNVFLHDVLENGRRGQVQR